MVLNINISSLINGDLDDCRYEILLTRLTYDDKIDKHVALCKFSKLGNLEIIKYLVSIGANIHTNDSYPIILASTFGHLEIVNT